jgi:membrane-associated protease RseP (regulator of RpoE activity)
VEPGSAAASAGVLVGDAVQVVNGAATAGLTEIGVKALLQPRPVSVLFVRPVSRVERLGEMTSKWRGKLSTGFSNFGEGKNCRPGTAIAS